MPYYSSRLPDTLQVSRTEERVRSGANWEELLDATFDNVITEFNTKPYSVGHYGGAWVTFFIESTLAPTNIMVQPQYGLDYEPGAATGVCIWPTFKEGFWASLGWEDVDTASGIWETYYLPCGGRDWVRFHIVANGTDAANTFRMRILIRKFRGAHGAAHA